MASERFDVIIIGSGAGGGTLAYRLAPSGKRILLIERGDHLPLERENWDSHAVFVDSRYRAPETWHDAAGHEFHPGIQYYVGGNTKVYGAALFRLRKEDFGELRHAGGISPAWPIRYDDLEPYYTQAERLYHVHGRHGVDPTDPPASGEYQFPPVAHEPRIQELADGLTRLGRHPFPLPVGLLLDEVNGQPLRTSRCVKCSAFDGFPCPLLAKADAEVICVTPALEHPNVTLLTRAHVDRLETSASGREVTTVHVTREGQREQFAADVVVVACGAVNSAALLLRSASDRHPRGLANGSDVIGRHYMRHNNSVLMAVSTQPNPTRFQKTLALNDFYLGAPDWPHPLGHIQMMGKSDAEMLRAEASGWHGMVADVSPRTSLEMVAKHALDFWLMSEDLPDPQNRVTLDAQGGILLALRETNIEAHQRLIAALKKMLVDLGGHEQLLQRSAYFGQNIPIGGTAHQCGTVRFGTDPATSALDINCKAHELDNLYVVDASFFPSAGAVNPSLTIIANALRVGDHLLKRMS